MEGFDLHETELSVAKSERLDFEIDQYLKEQRQHFTEVIDGDIDEF